MTREEAESLLARYSVRTTDIDRAPDSWDCLLVEVLLDGDPVGSYRRNYGCLFDTFVPFVAGEQVLALYSPDYTATRLMRLPECVDIGGEEPDGMGFCPTGYVAPYDPAKGLMGQWGVVSGCVWGDDSSWKMQYLDLSRAAEGILVREERFGYLEMPSNLRLKQCVDLWLFRGGDHQEVELVTRRVFDLKRGRFSDVWEWAQENRRDRSEQQP